MDRLIPAVGWLDITTHRAEDGTPTGGILIREDHRQDLLARLAAKGLTGADIGMPELD